MVGMVVLGWSGGGAEVIESGFGSVVGTELKGYSEQ